MWHRVCVLELALLPYFCSSYFPICIYLQEIAARVIRTSEIVVYLRYSFSAHIFLFCYLTQFRYCTRLDDICRKTQGKLSQSFRGIPNAFKSLFCSRPISELWKINSSLYAWSTLFCKITRFHYLPHLPPNGERFCAYLLHEYFTYLGQYITIAHNKGGTGTARHSLRLTFLGGWTQIAPSNLSCEMLTSASSKIYYYA